MKRPITNLVIGLAFLATQLAAQPVFTVSPQTITANAGQNITVDVTVSNFNNILSFQYSMAWSPAVLQFTSVTNYTSQLSGFTSANFGTTNTASGQLSVSWFDPNVQGVNLPNGTVLYSLNFQVLTGNPTTISFGSTPTLIEVINGSGNSIGMTPQNASVNGGGGGGGGGGGNVQGFAVIASDTTITSGSSFCVKVSVNDFTNIVSMQYTMAFDKTKLQFTNLQGFNLNGLTAANFGTNQAASQGKITLSWLDPEVNGETLPNGTVIYQVCFTAIGTNNCSAPTLFEFTNNPTIPEVTNTSGGVVPFQGIPGEINICNGTPGGGLKIKGNQIFIAPSGNGCVDVSAENFTNIVSAQFSMHFTQSVVTYDSVTGFGLPDLAPSNFGTSQAASGTLTFSWLDQTTVGITVPNNTVIFKVCFNAVGTNGQTSPLSFNGTPTGIEFTNSASQIVTPAFTSGLVTIGNNCGGPVVIAANPAITNVKCNGATTGAIDITVSGGSNQYVYTWKNAAGTTVGTTQDLANVPAGTYSVTVSSCSGTQTQTATYTISQPAVISITSQVTNPPCFGQTSGSIDISVTGGTLSAPSCPTYTYKWSNNATTQDIMNLAAGNYKVTVTDCNTCAVTASLDVTGSPSQLAPTTSIVHVKCFGQNTGSITVTGGGGVGPYQYRINGGAWGNNNVFANLAGGSFIVDTRDAFGCVVTSNVTVNAPANIALTTTATGATTGNCNGSITLGVTGGTPGFTYSWSGPGGFSSNQQNISNLCSGNYCVTVTDGNSCTKTRCDVVSAPLSVTAAKKNACVGICDGTITLTVSGGIPPLQYQWTGGLPPTQNQSNLCPGSYSVTVTSTTDNQTQTLTVNVSQGTSLPTTVATNLTNPNSSTACNGSITVAGSGGSGPYTYLWSNGGTGPTISNLCEGTYTVTISDASLCTGTGTYTVEFNPVPLTALITSVPGCPNTPTGNGSLSVQPNGGTPPFKITITGPSGSFTQNNVATSANFPNLMPGAYSITITDGAGGSDQQQITLTGTVTAVNLTITPTNVYPATPSQNGKINIQPGGGAIPYSYQWSNGSTAQNPSNLEPGCYDLTMGDANGCYQVFQDICVGILNAQNIDQMPPCPDQKGTIALVPEGGNWPYTYKWRNSANQVIDQDSILNNQPVGSYTVQITDALGVSIILNYNITSVSNLDAVAEATTNFSGFNVHCNGGNSGAAKATALDGMAPYTYLWSNGATTPAISGLVANDYLVTVMDGAGCKIVKTVPIKQAPVLTTIADGDFLGCPGTKSGQATVNVSGGVVPYNFVWNDPLNQKTQTAILLSGGDYKVTVTDQNGCTSIKTATIAEPDELKVTMFTKPDEGGSGGPNGEASVVVTGGTFPYEYEWMKSLVKDSTLTELLPGRYFVKVTDDNGCEKLISGIVDDGTQCGEVLTVITPEGDGFNEEFKIGCLSRYSDNTLEIYNRWGQLVFDTKNYNDGDLWRGTNKRGNDVPDGVYFYVFEYLDPVNNVRTVRKGSVTVLRK